MSRNQFAITDSSPSNNPQCTETHARIAKEESRTIRFNVETNELAVFVYNLIPGATVQYLKDLFILNELGIVLSVHLVGSQSSKTSGSGSTSSTTTAAICVLAHPHQVRNALTYRYLVEKHNGRNGVAEIRKCSRPVKLSLFLCESLLNHHLPFRWSHTMSCEPAPHMQDTLKQDENNSTAVSPCQNVWKVTAAIFSSSICVARAHDLIDFDSHEMKEVIGTNGDSGFTDVVKKLAGTVLRNAMDQVEIVFPSDGGMTTLRSLQRDTPERLGVNVQGGIKLDACVGTSTDGAEPSEPVAKDPT